MNVLNYFSHAWNLFKGRNFVKTETFRDYGLSYSYRPDRMIYTPGSERTIISSIYTRIGIDVAAITIQHVRLDENERYVETIKSGLNNCLTISANIDQTGRAFIQDVAMSLCDEGSVAIVPTDASVSPLTSNSYDINELRVAKIVEWFPKYVRVELYNDETGARDQLVFPKDKVAIVENPLYSVMNEPNSTLQRLIQKLALLDKSDNKIASGKLDLIIHFPYSTKSSIQRENADRRRDEIEHQIMNSPLGIAYIDGTEKITQLNRPVENNLLAEIEYLTKTLYSQLGITEEVFNGSADESTMLNYYTRTIDPIVAAICDSIKRTFLTKTARSQGQSIMYFRNPFRLIPASEFADIAYQFSQNRILTVNEIRSIIGYKPDDNPASDTLGGEEALMEEEGDDEAGEFMFDSEEEYEEALARLDDYDSQLDEIENSLGFKHYASPYYDPVKAHEYYMRNRELKKRRSTAGLNEEGKNAARYVREQLRNERKQKVADSKSKTDSDVKSLQAQTKKNIEQAREEKQEKLEHHNAQMEAQIANLKRTLEAMSDEEKAANSEKIQGEIDAARAANKAERQEIQDDYNAFVKRARSRQSFKTKSLREQHRQNTQQYKEEYESKYDSELEKIKSTASFQKQKKSSSKSASKSGSKSTAKTSTSTPKKKKTKRKYEKSSDY